MNRLPQFSPFFPAPFKGARGISGPGGTVSANFGEFRGAKGLIGAALMIRKPTPFFPVSGIPETVSKKTRQSGEAQS